MNIIMLGAPGSGKGTIGAKLCEKFNLVHVATGDIFREEIKNQTELGIKASEYMKDGKLVPDEITIGMVENKLDQLDNVLLDGFPRTKVQAEAFKDYLNRSGKKITAVINLDVPDDDIILRTSNRIICPNKTCGASYNTLFLKPKVEGICDICGSKLIKRDDDNEETIAHRLEIYHETTKPLLAYYKEQNLLYSIPIDIYSKTTMQDTTNRAIEIIEKLENM